ncbi:hypothetical protein ACFVQ9_36765 [Streptomyces goshikiensis]|uniref:hypothetical protein n=1 Tax=Streptomyces goshikiensis TaxID=1942 RepID=UPI0036D011EB
MNSVKRHRAYAALQHTVNALEGTSWTKSIGERGFRLSVGLERDVLSVSPRSTIPGPSALQVYCRYPEDQRLQRVRTHMACLRGDLLSIGLDFADPFPDTLKKIVNGDPVTVTEYEPSRVPSRSS